MKIEIKVNVFVPNGKYCSARECDFCYCGNCALFSVFLDKIGTDCKYLKCQECMDALAKSEHGEVK